MSTPDITLTIETGGLSVEPASPRNGLLASPRNGLLSPGGPSHAYSDAVIRLGTEYQCIIPEQASGTLQSEDLTSRADELLTIDFTPLTEPPPPQYIESLWGKNSPMGKSCGASVTGGPKTVVETYDCDSDGVPNLPPGLTIGGLCLAKGSNAGETRMYKAYLLGVRAIFPCVLVRYIGTAEGLTSPLLVPTVPKSYVNIGDVEPWVEPSAATMDAIRDAHDPDVDIDGASSSAPVARTMRARPAKPEISLLTSSGGFRLHLDPKRHTDGYTGCGYKGVADDGWQCGYKAERPYVVSYEGKYQGRYATVEQAAVAYARVDMGLSPRDARSADGVAGGGGGAASGSGGAAGGSGGARAGGSSSGRNETAIKSDAPSAAPSASAVPMPPAHSKRLRGVEAGPGLAILPPWADVNKGKPESDSQSDRPGENTKPDRRSSTTSTGTSGMSSRSSPTRASSRSPGAGAPSRAPAEPSPPFAGAGAEEGGDSPSRRVSKRVRGEVAPKADVDGVEQRRNSGVGL